MPGVRVPCAHTENRVLEFLLLGAASHPESESLCVHALKFGVTVFLCVCTRGQGSNVHTMRNRVKSLVLSATFCVEDPSTWGIR